MKVARVTSHSGGPLNPWCFNVPSAYIVWAPRTTNRSTCMVNERLHWKMTPRIFILSTRSIPRRGGGAADLVLGRLMIISFDLSTFNIRLLLDAHVEIWSSSSRTSCELIDGTMRYESSAYLFNLSSAYRGSLALITYANGPMTDPCTILALINNIREIKSSNLVQCCLFSKNFRSQLCTKSWMGKSAHLLKRVECRTVSNALEKSKAMRCTYGNSSRSLEIWCVKLMSALVVDPVGRNAYGPRREASRMRRTEPDKGIVWPQSFPVSWTVWGWPRLDDIQSRRQDAWSLGPVWYSWPSTASVSLKKAARGCRAKPVAWQAVVPITGGTKTGFHPAREP